MTSRPRKEIPRLLITVEEAAELLSLGRTTMYKWIRRYHVPVVRFDGRVLISPTSLAEWIKSREQ